MFEIKSSHAPLSLSVLVKFLEEQKCTKSMIYFFGIQYTGTPFEGKFVSAMSEKLSNEYAMSYDELCSFEKSISQILEAQIILQVDLKDGNRGPSLIIKNLVAGDRPRVNLDFIDNSWLYLDIYDGTYWNVGGIKAVEFIEMHNLEVR